MTSNGTRESAHSRAACTGSPSRGGCTDPVALREAWRKRSFSSGWLAADDWWTAAVDAIAGAACRDSSLTLGCAMLGRERARAGIGITEAIADLAALFAELNGGDPPLALVSSVAEGWAEAGLARLSQATCDDPLTGLVTLPYLRTRLAEVYRDGREQDTSPAETHRLIVVELPRRPDPWKRVALAILVGHDLRTVFPGGETLSLARPGPAIALVRVCGDLPFRFTGLRRTINAAFGTQVRMVRLPARLEDAARLLDELAH